MHQQKRIWCSVQPGGADQADRRHDDDSHQQGGGSRGEVREERAPAGADEAKTEARIVRIEESSPEARPCCQASIDAARGRRAVALGRDEVLPRQEETVADRARGRDHYDLRGHQEQVAQHRIVCRSTGGAKQNIEWAHLVISPPARPEQSTAGDRDERTNGADRACSEHLQRTEQNLADGGRRFLRGWPRAPRLSVTQPHLRGMVKCTAQA
jgi:hypothetical protein